MIWETYRSGETKTEVFLLVFMQVMSFFFAGLIVASIIALLQEATKQLREFDERNSALKSAGLLISQGPRG